MKALHKEGFTTAYQLQQKSSPNYPAFTLRRIMVNGRWSGTLLQQEMKRQFNVGY